MSIIDKLKHRILNTSEGVLKTDVNYLARGGFWVTVSQAVYVGTGFLQSVVFANFLAPTLYGVYKYITSVYSLFSISTLNGVSTSYSQAVARGNEGDLKKVIKTKISFGLIGTLASLVLAAYYFINANTEFGYSFVLVAIFLPFMETFSVYDVYFQGKRRFDLATSYLLVEQVVAVAVLVIALVLFHPSVVVLTALYLISWTGIRALLLWYMKRTIPPNHQTEDGTVTYGLHLTAISIIPLIGQYIDRVLVFHFLGPVSLAGYNFATIIPDQIKSYFKNLQGLAVPKMSVADPLRVRTGVLRKTWLIILILAFAMICYLLMAPYFFMWLFPKYVFAVQYSQLYALSIIFTGAVLPMLALQTQEMKAALYKYNIIRSLFQIVSLALLLWYAGLWGIIIARILNDLFALLIGLLYVHQMKRV